MEHVKRRPLDYIQCGVCEASAGQISHWDTNDDTRNGGHESHPVEFINDGSDRWWQSPTIVNGLKYHRVTITLDLRQVS